MQKKLTSHYYEKKSALGFLHSSDPAEKNVMISVMSLRAYYKYLIQAL